LRDNDVIALLSLCGLQGAADFAEFYYVWSRILENMAVVGYDSSNTVIMGYDWRLSADLMEVCDPRGAGDWVKSVGVFYSN
jgi:phospholipid:diacylglycerol acyltransferase